MGEAHILLCLQHNLHLPWPAPLGATTRRRRQQCIGNTTTANTEAEIKGRESGHLAPSRHNRSGRGRGKWPFPEAAFTKALRMYRWRERQADRNHKDTMKLIVGFLTVWGLAAAQAAQAPSPVQQPSGNAARSSPMPIYRVTVLSENRGGAVRDYLTQEGMASGSVSSRGFGKAQPVATNDTAAGKPVVLQ
jgi:hypothetical protein